MADFFARLIARSNGDAPAVQPVIAPRFAEGPAVAEEREHELPEIRQTETPALTPIKLPFHASSVPANLLPPRSSDIPGQFSRRSEEMLADQFGRPLTSCNRSVLPKKPDPDVVASLPNSPDAGVESHLGDLAFAPQDPTNPTQRSRRKDSREAQADVRVAEEDREPAENTLPLPAPQPRATHRDTTRRERFRNTSAEPQGTRNIRVTIGRVDVRAILPTKESATRARNTPATSPLPLEEYLKQRKAGQR